MAGQLFVERFLIAPVPAPCSDGEYDEQRAYAVTADGAPVVAVCSAGETHTVTEVRNEAPDSDPSPDVETLTFVEAEGADVAYSFLADETFTRVRREGPDLPEASAGTETLTKVKGEAPDDLSMQVPAILPADASDTPGDRSRRLATITRTSVDYPRDDDSD